MPPELIGRVLIRRLSVRVQVAEFYNVNLFGGHQGCSEHKRTREPVLRKGHRLCKLILQSCRQSVL